ncbi:hypothetical protein EV715DRAFT_274160 [Schizophyllum commune]
MSFPYYGSYFTFRLDPVASLQDIEDDEVAEAARKISPKVYVGCPLEIIGAPQLPPAYLVADVALVQQGLPPERPEEFLESRIKVTDIPSWQVKEAEEAERLAYSPPDDDHYVEDDENSDSTSAYSAGSRICSSGGSDEASDFNSTRSGDGAREDAAMDTGSVVDDNADFERDILAAMNPQSDSHYASPVIVPLSYDLGSLDAPPSPTGFMQELEEINRIRSEYEQRVLRLKEEIRRRDDEYVAGIEARRTAKSPEEPQNTSSPSTQFKWPFASNIVPFTYKLKARLARFLLSPHIPQPLNMSFPDTGSYYTFRLDPVASLQDIEDEEVAKAARELSPQVYVACTLEAFGVPRAPPAYEAAHISLVQLGLPVDSPEEFLESRMCVPIRPNTQHPEGRRPAHCCHPLPWDGCYHVASHRTRVRIKTEMRPVNPPHSLSASECVVLSTLIEDDEQRRDCLRECAAKGVAPPPASLGEMALTAMRLADRKVSDVPYWQIKAAQRAEREASRPDESHEDPHENDDTASGYSGVDSHPGDGNNDGAPSGASHSGTVARADAAMDAPQAADDIADVEDDILAAINYQSDLRDTSPVIKPLSYDLSSLDAPPSPAGFIEELKAIHRIRTEYEERVRRLKDEIRRRDEEYMAGIEARRIAEETQATSPAPAQSRWPSAVNLLPLTNKLKARMVFLRGRSASPSKCPSNSKPRRPKLLVLSSAWKRCWS